MNKITKRIPVCILIFLALSCSVFPSGRPEAPLDEREARVFWVLDGTMSAESSEMFVERYLLPTSLAAMRWTEFTVTEQEVRFDTRGGYRVTRRNKVLTDPIGAFTVYGYDVIVDIVRASQAQPAPKTSPESYLVRFSYPQSAASGSGVVPQPLEQALLAGIRKDGRPAGKGRVESVEYLGSGRFKATVLISD
jgi:hypothetical protein